jgi:hypothetical protein
VRQAALKDQLTTDTQVVDGPDTVAHRVHQRQSTDVLVRLASIEGGRVRTSSSTRRCATPLKSRTSQREAEIREMAVQMGQSLGRFEDEQKKLSATVKS